MSVTFDQEVENSIDFGYSAGEMQTALVNAKQTIVPHSADKSKAALIKALELELYAEECRVRTKVEEQLKLSKLAKVSQVVADYFRHTDTPLYFFNCTSPLDFAGTLLSLMLSRYRMVQIALLETLDVTSSTGTQALESIAETAMKFNTNGQKVHFFVDVPYMPHSQLLKNLMNPANGLLGMQPGRDTFQAIALEIFRADNDKNQTLRRSSLGAALGRRAALDARYSVAEPMAGIRPGPDGAKGGIKAQIAGQGYSLQEINSLARFGINCALRDDEFGDCIYWSNRSLLDNQDSAYSAASPVRLRLFVSAMFHRLVEVNVMQDGKRTNGSLEHTMAMVNKFLNRLIEEGWLKGGSAKVDYSRRTVRIQVNFQPTQVIDNVYLEFDEFEDEA